MISSESPSICPSSSMQGNLPFGVPRVLPLQCAVALLLCLALLPVQPLRLNATPMLAVSVLWLGGVISVGATVLLYGMLRSGNLVNVTSLF